MKKYWIGVSLLLAAVAGGAYWHARTPRIVGNDVVVVNDRPAATAHAAAAPASSAPAAPTPPKVNYGYPFQDTSMLKPPAGAKVAIYEFEDLECPACAHAFPIVRAAVDHYHIPLVRHDFALTEIHIWSFDAAVTARYIEDNVSPKLADAFRGDVFAAQAGIASKDDLARFTAKWFQAHGQRLPFVMDANGACRQEVTSDRALGDRIGIHSTPCIFVVTQNSWTPIADVDQLDRTIEAALAQTGARASVSFSGSRFTPAMLTALSRL
jgi:protein-disulfide isomerase